MVNLWEINKLLKPQRPILCGYRWDEHGFVMDYLDVVDNNNIQITFHVDLDGFRIIYLTNGLEANDRTWVLMDASGIHQGPITPFFIQDNSEFIDVVKKMHGYDAERLKYLQYTMKTDDFWIEVVSSQPPTVTITPAEDSK